jgi:hypothetical protein
MHHNLNIAAVTDGSGVLEAFSKRQTRMGRLQRLLWVAKQPKREALFTQAANLWIMTPIKHAMGTVIAVLIDLKSISYMSATCSLISEHEEG